MNQMGARIRGKVPTRTIAAALAMLAGIVLIGYGYYQEEYAMLYIGVAMTLGGVMTEAIFRLTQRPTGNHRERMTRA
jgi:hypothetical protein